MHGLKDRNHMNILVEIKKSLTKPPNVLFM